VNREYFTGYDPRNRARQADYYGQLRSFMIDLILTLLALLNAEPPAHCKKGDGGVCGS
jgi:hypothetical protein